jgi:hypothetical protein
MMLLAAVVSFRGVSFHEIEAQHGARSGRNIVAIFHRRRPCQYTRLYNFYQL